MSRVRKWRSGESPSAAAAHADDDVELGTLLAGAIRAFDETSRDLDLVDDIVGALVAAPAELQRVALWSLLYGWARLVSIVAEDNPDLEPAVFTEVLLEQIGADLFGGRG